jgi:hypothetical protein
VEPGHGRYREATDHLHGDQEAADTPPIGQPAHRNGGENGAEKEERGQRAELLAAEVEGVAQERGQGAHTVDNEQGNQLRQTRQGQDQVGGPRGGGETHKEPFYPSQGGDLLQPCCRSRTAPLEELVGPRDALPSA